jgi:hypothetical protein
VVDLSVYVPLGLGVLAAAFLIWRYPLSVPRDRVPVTIATFLGAYVLFVILDIVSGRALTSITDLPKAASVLLIAVAALLLGNVVYLFLRSRRAPR